MQELAKFYDFWTFYFNCYIQKYPQYNFLTHPYGSFTMKWWQTFPFDYLFAFFISHQSYEEDENVKINRIMKYKEWSVFSSYIAVSMGCMRSVIGLYLQLKCYNFFTSLWTFLWNSLNVQYSSFDISWSQLMIKRGFNLFHKLVLTFNPWWCET